MSNKYVMGIDGGTGGIRVGIYDLNGNEIVFSSTKYDTFHENPGWAEQDPNDWWEALGKSSNEALKESGINPDDIVALSYDVTACSVMLCMNDGTPIRNPLIWMDVRASQEAKDIRKTEHRRLKMNNFGEVSPEWMPCKALWLKRNEYENYSKAEKVCEYADWLTFKLTNKWTRNLSNISTRWYYDSTDGGFSTSFYTEIGLSDVLEKFPQDERNLGDNLGTLTPEAANHLGLSNKTIVGQGGPDAFVGIVGLGAINPGDIALITGSSHLIMGITDQFDREVTGSFGPYPDAIEPGLGFIEGGQTSSGSILSWYVNNFCQNLKTENQSPYDILNEKATDIPIGSNGLMVLDWWQGNRTPYTDGNIRGLVNGLSLGHTQAHIYRSIMEGVAYGTENVFQSFRNAGIPVDTIYIGGGTIQSPLWLQIHSNVSNVIIKVPNNTQAPTLGSAIYATLAAGIYQSLEEAIENMVSIKETIYPDEEKHKQYQKYFTQYQKAYPDIGDWMKKTTNI